MRETWFSRLSLYEVRLLALAGLGPTGVQRSLEAISFRLTEEGEELAEAIAARDLIGAIEEGGDVAYYGLLLVANGGTEEDLALYRSLLERARKQVAEGFGLAHFGVNRLLRAAIAKYEARFIVNQRAKDKVAERWAIARQVPHLLVPARYGHRPQPTGEEGIVRCACGAEWRFSLHAGEKYWYPQNEEALWPCE